MAGFKTSFFKGIRPRISALKLPEGEAVTAANLKLGSGDLVPWTERDDGVPVGDPFKNQTIYRYDNAGNPVWFEWSSFVSVARGSVKGDIQERIYYTGDGVPKMTFRDIATNGPGPFPQAFRKLGIPSPNSPPTVLGSALPESRSPAERRVLANTLFTKKYEIAFVNWTVFPGTGGATAEWIRPAGIFTGDIFFDLNEGDTIKVVEVLDKDTVTLGSATGTGAFAETANNDKINGNTNFELMDNVGSTQLADWIGWRIPDGLKVTIADHLLRVGDVIRVTRLDRPEGIVLTIPASTLSFFEQSWATEGSVTIGGVTFTQTVNATVGADAAGEADFPTLKGSFFYEVVRENSDASVLEDRTYIYTYVSSLGEEGPPSPVSLVVQALDGDAIEVTGIELPPTDGLDITQIRLYRTSSTLAGTEYQFVKEFDIATSVTESVKQANLGEIIITTTWCGPPEGMQGITEMPNGMMVGFVGRTIHMSEPYFPHAYPPEYDQAINFEIVGLAAFGNSVLVLTEGTPYILTGSHPRNVNVRPIKIKQACVSAESIAADKDRVVYASPDGLVEIGVNGARIVTEQYVEKDEWAAFVPETMVGDFHDGKYFGFFDGPDNVPQAPASVAVTGTLATEVGVIAGGQTIILTLTSDTWVASGAVFDAQRQNIIDGLVARKGDKSTTDFITGFNIAVRPNILVGEVARTSPTVVTITLAAQSGYSITDAETIFSDVPATALVTSTIKLDGDVGLEITPLTDFSSIAIAFTERDSAGTDVPSAITSQLDITDWDAYPSVSTIFKDEADIDAAAYSPSLDRWLAVGQRSGTAPSAPDTNVFATSDDNGVTWTGRTNAFNLFTDTAVGPRAAIWDANHDVFVVGGAEGSLQSSPDGESWIKIPFDLLVPHVSIQGFALSTAGVPDHIYGIMGLTNFMIRSPDLKLAPVTNTWSGVPITYVSSIGSRQVASGASVIISIGSDLTDMEVCETAHGAASGASVGAISTYNCQGLTFGNDLWVALSNDFRVITCPSGDQGTIGNWSSPSTTKAAGVNIKGITFDEGDGVTQGYGYIAFGEITASSLGVIYTSPDAITWTLRFTTTPTIDIDAMAVKFPESNLGDALTAWAPTFNGAQSPTQLGDTFANYEAVGLGVPAGCSARTNITVEFQATDVILRISGSDDPNIVSTDVGDSFEQATTTILNLNDFADSVRITITEIDNSLSDPFDQFGRVPDTMVGVLPIFGSGEPYGSGEFVEDVFFTPVVGFEYGFELKAVASALAGFAGASDPITFQGDGFAIITFTFRRLNFEDLSLSYKLHSKAQAKSQS